MTEITTPVSTTTTDSSEVANLLARLEGLRAVQEVARDLTAELDLDLLLHKILRSAVTVMKSTAGSLLLYEPASAELVFEVVEGGGGEALEKMRIRSDQGIAGACFTSGSPIIVEDVSRDRRYFSAPADHFGLQIRTLMAVPLIAKGNPIGVLEVMNKSSGETFNKFDQDLLLAFASQSAIAIENARLYRDLIQERDRIVAVEGAVRHELARDLHDGPAQLLSAIIMNVRFLREMVTRTPEHAGSELLQVEALAQKALYQVRNMLFDLRPVILETHGLGPALEAYVERLHLVEPFSIKLNLRTPPPRFSPKVEAAVFSIVQEAVNNAKKHAAPRHLWLTVQQQDRDLVITVKDDGRGFDVSGLEEAAVQRGSLGLLTMRERAEIAHARLEIESRPNHGTTVTLHVPVDEGRRKGERRS